MCVERAARATLTTKDKYKNVSKKDYRIVHAALLLDGYHASHISILQDPELDTLGSKYTISIFLGSCHIRALPARWLCDLLSHCYLYLHEAESVRC